MKGVCCIDECTWLLCVNPARGSRTVPIFLVLAGEDSKVFFKLLVKVFSLAIGLWVIGCQSCEFNTKYAIELVSELGDELRTSI
jgi:hypothetical protein